LYLTTSRSLSGFLRDFFLINTASLFNLKIVNHLHGSDFIEFYQSTGGLVRRLVDSTYGKVHVSIVLLPAMAEQYAMFPRMKVVSIPNCATNIDSVQLDHVTNTQKLKLLYLSNLMYSKGVTLLVDAVKELQSEGIDVSLTVAGKPMADEYMSEDKIWQEFDNRVTASNYVKYVGVAHGKAKESLLVSSDVFVLPTFYKTEAFPISVIEAMHSGLAIVTTEHNYMKDVVSKANGILIQTKSIESLKSAIKTLYNDRKLLKEMGQYNKCVAREHYSIDQYVSSITKLIDRVCEVE
jgi:glycosyltransferase involved in cell wall biosynthesis